MRTSIFQQTMVLSIILIIITSTQCNKRTSTRQENLSLLTLEQIFKSKEFTLESLGPTHWLPGKTGFTMLKDSTTTAEGKDIVSYNPESDIETVLVSAERLIPHGQEKPLDIFDYTWSGDGQKLLIYTNTKKVWRLNTRGDYWVLDMDSWKLQKLGGNAKESTLMFAKFSPDGSKVGYVMTNNIYVEELASGRIIPLTKDGSKDIINGTSDWVYEEEFSLRDAFRWSPDGQHIAFWQFDSSGIKEFHMINNTDSLYPKLISFRHAKVGVTNSACRVGVINASGGKTLWFNPPGNSRDYYIPRMDWASNSEEIIFQRLNRLQNTNWAMLGEIKTGKFNTIFMDKDDAWVEVVEEIFWLNDGQSFIWISERDGWRHIYLISRDGKEITCLTPGEFDVISMGRLDEEKGWIYFTASPDDPNQSFLYRVPLDGSGTLERISPQDQEGYNIYQFSDDGKWAVHTLSSLDTPPITNLIRLPNHKTARSLVKNSVIMEKVKTSKRQPPEFFDVDIGNGKILKAWCMKPHDFDPKKKYPMLFYIYGEPAGSTTSNSWRTAYYLWHLLLTQKGYIVMSVDPRGTKMPRGREWRKSIYRKVGILAAKYHAAACRKILAERPYIDPQRVGVWGWSGGGSMSLNMIFRYPELYSAAIAIAFVADQRLYDTIYQERYMGLPGDNEENYIEGSPITHAHKLEGNLMIIHGTADDNVHYQCFERLVNELIKHEKHFSMMSYPNRSHGINEGENTRLHLFSTMTRFLMDNLPPGPQ
ncbi:S9 family peptidase [Acidobacteriota bacterium]